jgi:hypothetical protein
VWVAQLDAAQDGRELQEAGESSCLEDWQEGPGGRDLGRALKGEWDLSDWVEG